MWIDLLFHHCVAIALLVAQDFVPHLCCFVVEDFVLQLIFLADVLVKNHTMYDDWIEYWWKWKRPWIGFLFHHCIAVALAATDDVPNDWLSLRFKSVWSVIQWLNRILMNMEEIVNWFSIPSLYKSLRLQILEWQCSSELKACLLAYIPILKSQFNLLLSEIYI